MFKPMLAPNNDPAKDPEFFDKLRYPLLCSPKVDGIRCIVKIAEVTEFTSTFDRHVVGYKNVCKSRKYIDLPNKHVQRLFSNYLELDGELILDHANFEGIYNKTQSIVMSIDKAADDIKFQVFDCADPTLADEPFFSRLAHAEELIKEYNEEFGSNVEILRHDYIENLEQLLEYEMRQLNLGYEGIMMRDPVGRYKYGRGTFNEGLIYKLKRFTDAEAVTVGFKERMHNANEDVRDNLGNAKRSSAKDGLVPAGTLGLIVVDWNGVHLDISTGVLTKDEMKTVWENQDRFLGKLCKFRYFEYGVKELPRFPRFVGWRSTIDL